jgi:hypothetical protein
MSYVNSPDIPDAHIARYEMLRLVRDNLIYREYRRCLELSKVPTDFDKIRALENPAAQAVEFHQMHVFPGSLEEAFPIELEPDDPLRVAAYRILRDGRFGIQKDYAVETTATCGDVFFQARLTDSGKAVYPDVVDPDFVTEFEEDNRGNLTYVRLDWEDLESDSGETFTEIFSKENDFYSLWHHNLGLSVETERILEETPIGPYPVKMSSFGHDFVPFVRFPARQSFRRGERCKGIFELHMEALVQLNRDVTVDKDRYFRHNKPLWQSITQNDKPTVYEELNDDDEEPKNPDEGRYPDNEAFVRNPKNTRLETLVPPLNWQAGLDRIEASRQSLGRSMSEIRFFDGVDKGDPSALAIIKHQDPSYRRAKALRANGEEAVLAVIKMCISIGQRRGLYPPSLGSFDDGSFDGLTFKPRPISPETAAEKAVRRQQEAEGYSAAREVSSELLEAWLIEDGYDPEKAKAMAASQTAAPSALERLMGGGVVE